jgi:hypothetical protein
MTRHDPNGFTGALWVLTGASTSWEITDSWFYITTTDADISYASAEGTATPASNPKNPIFDFYYKVGGGGRGSACAFLFRVL